MIVQSIHFTFAPDDADEVEAIALELRDASRKEAGVVSYDVGRSRDKPGVFAFWEVYRDAASLEAHLQSEHFNRLVVGRIRPMLKERNFEKVDLL
ncbi:MAG: antibiotic biosynthesis monooxygenase [Candidatus Eremiobacteraeota bacterium]|nr:antibiotic biosynthesis monooxygenase [Candidatus Eremiobacteraeota bacterium]